MSYLPPGAMGASRSLQRAVSVLRHGGVLAYPTEAVFGLGCDPQNRDALQRLLRIKQRPWQKGLILIAADFAQLRPYVLPLSVAQWAQIQATWPGPVTWLLPARPGVSRQLRGVHNTIAVRVTAHQPTIALCRAFGGAIVSTSANRSGQWPARTTRAVRKQLGSEVDYILPGRLGGAAQPSQIRDLVSGQIVRMGSSADSAVPDRPTPVGGSGQSQDG